jgi:hypothetical protein
LSQFAYGELGKEQICIEIFRAATQRSTNFLRRWKL